MWSPEATTGETLRNTAQWQSMAYLHTKSVLTNIIFQLPVWLSIFHCAWLFLPFLHRRCCEAAPLQTSGRWCQINGCTNSIGLATKVSCAPSPTCPDTWQLAASLPSLCRTYKNVIRISIGWSENDPFDETKNKCAQNTISMSVKVEPSWRPLPG